MTKKEINHEAVEEVFEEDFLNNLLVQAWFDPEEDDFDMLKAELEPVLMDRIITRVFEELNDAQRKEVMKLFDEKKEAEALTKIEKMIPNYDDFLANIFEEFQEEYLRNME